MYKSNPENFCRRFATLEETRISHYTALSMKQFKAWAMSYESVPTMANMVLLAGKMMNTVF